MLTQDGMSWLQEAQMNNLSEMVHILTKVKLDEDAHKNWTRA